MEQDGFGSLFPQQGARQVTLEKQVENYCSRPCGEQGWLRPRWGECEGKRILCIITSSKQLSNRII